MYKDSPPTCLFVYSFVCYLLSVNSKPEFIISDLPYFRISLLPFFFHPQILLLIYVMILYLFYLILLALLLVLLLSGRRNPGNIVWFSFSSSGGSTSRYCAIDYFAPCGILRLEKVHCFLSIGRCQVLWISVVQPKIKLPPKAKIGHRICCIL